MTHTAKLAASLILATPLAPAPAAAQHVAPRAYAAQLAAFLDRLNRDPNAPPGAVVIVVQGKRTLLARAIGLRNARTGARMTLDTPVYTASTTKSYTGLLAAELDRKRLLPIGTRLTDIWPGLTLPAPLDASGATVARLLSHSAGFTDTGLTFQSNATGQYSLTSIPAHLARYATPTRTPFEYSNFGPFLYSMMVRQRLGMDWRDALARHVLRPLEMTRTSARLEDFRPGEAAHCHTRTAPGAAWDSLPLKPTPLLNAAGGIFSSANDTARYLKAFTGHGAGGIPASSLALTGKAFSDQDREIWGFRRTHYGLGWDVGTYGQAPVWLRAGGFDGCRAMFAVFPDQDFAVGVLTVSDIGANGYNAAIIQQAFDLWTGDPAAAANADRRTRDFAREAAAAFAPAGDTGAEAPEVPISPQLLASYAGRYASDRLGIFTITPAKGRLQAEMGEFRPVLVPTGKDVFRNLPSGGAPGEPFTFVRDVQGRIVRLLWGERDFVRLP